MNLRTLRCWTWYALAANVLTLLSVTAQLIDDGISLPVAGRLGQTSTSLTLYGFWLYVSNNQRRWAYL